MTTTLHAIIATAAPDHTGVDPERQTRELRVDGRDYGDARERLHGQVPDGWRLLWLRAV